MLNSACQLSCPGRVGAPWGREGAVKAQLVPAAGAVTSASPEERGWSITGKPVSPGEGTRPWREGPVCPNAPQTAPVPQPSQAPSRAVTLLPPPGPRGAAGAAGARTGSADGAQQRVRRLGPRLVAHIDSNATGTC